MKSTGSWYYVKTQKGIVKCKLKGNFKIKGIRSTNPIAVGDIVDYIEQKEENVGLINKIHDRKNYIARKSINLSRQSHVIASNIDYLFLIVTLKSPKTYTLFIDRILIFAEMQNIPSYLVFNKIDIYNDADFQELKSLEEIYGKLGYKSLQISVTEDIGINEIKKIIKGKTILITGNSGVGKSSLINKLEPNLKLATTDVSEMHGQGRHTTTFAEMHKVAGAMLIDTPGIKGFGLVELDKLILSKFYPEMRDYKCKFNNCTHTHEPECKVKEAVAENKISKLRYENYLNIMAGDEGKYREDIYKV